jgi:hypothetical protein
VERQITSTLAAPYESVPDDDLSAAAAATVTGALALLVAVSLGMQAWRQLPNVDRVLDAGSFQEADVPLLSTTFGWGAAAVLMTLGALLLSIRRGRGTVIFGSLIGLAATLLARVEFGWFTPEHPLEHLPVYFAGAAVVLLALLPGTRRWISGRRQRNTLPPVLSVESASRRASTL